MWMDAVHVTVGQNNLESSYKAYASWCHDTGNRAKTQQNFATDIRHLFPQAVNSSGRIGLAWTDTEAEALNSINTYGCLEALNGLYDL